MSLFRSPEASNIHPAASKHPNKGFIYSALLFENSLGLSFSVAVLSSWWLIQYESALLGFQIEARQHFAFCLLQVEAAFYYFTLLFYYPKVLQAHRTRRINES